MNDHQPTALVTGAGGFIGSHLCRRLLDMAWQVTAMDCLSDNYDVRIKRANLISLASRQGFALHQSGVHHLGPDGLEAGFDYVFHLAGRPGVRSSYGDQLPLYIRDNVTSTQRLLAACVNRQPRRVIVASSSSVYGDCANGPATEDQPLRPASPYATTKAGAEAVCASFRRQHGIAVVCLRFFTVYGPQQRPDMAVERFMRAILSGAPVEILGDGQQSRHMTYVDDVVEAMVLAALAPAVSNTYNIAGEQTVTVDEIVRMVEGISGIPAQVRRREPHPGDARHTSGDIALARDELGYTPTVDLEEGLRRQFEGIKSSTAISTHTKQAGGANHECTQAA